MYILSLFFADTRVYIFFLMSNKLFVFHQRIDFIRGLYDVDAVPLDVVPMDGGAETNTIF